MKGFNLGGAETMTVDPPDAAGHGTSAFLPIPGFEGNPVPSPRLAVGRYPEKLEAEPNDMAALAQPVPVPGVVNGTIGAVEGFGWDQDDYLFCAKAGETIVLEVEAARLGSPLDSYLEILTRDGEPLERATVRCVAQTVMSLSDRDSRSAGIRLASWTDFAMNDYAMLGSEILKVRRLPGYADEDVQFHAHPTGQRMGYFGTTPEAHAVDSKVYKVEIHPPGATFPPNGLPTFRLTWRNDDMEFEGQMRAGDSRIEFVAPESGMYVARVRDANERGGPRFAYRLELRNPAPDFDVVAGPFRPNVPEGGAVAIDVRVRRRDGFDGPVAVSLEELPEGFVAAPDTILPGEDTVKIALRAGEGAKTTPFDSSVKIVAKAAIGDGEVVRETRIGDLNVVPNPDLVVRTNATEIVLTPGGATTLDVLLERRNGFTGRVPVDVLNLPYGVAVRNTGLNGILVREHESERPGMEIGAEPWVEPMERTIYVQSRIETRSAQPVFVSEAVKLRIVPATPEGEKEKPGATIATGAE